MLLKEFCLREVELPQLLSFVDGLQMDKHGNLSAVVVVNDEVHSISLNFSHHPMHGGGDR